MILGLDHIQPAMPKGEEERARKFFRETLGLVAFEKPAALAGRGGLWFALPDGRQLHLGVEKPFRSAEKAHPAFMRVELDELARRLEAGLFVVRWDCELAPRRRFYGADPFGNRIEFVEP